MRARLSSSLEVDSSPSEPRRCDLDRATLQAIHAQEMINKGGWPAKAMAGFDDWPLKSLHETTRMLMPTLAGGGSVVGIDEEHAPALVIRAHAAGPPDDVLREGLLKEPAPAFPHANAGDLAFA